MTQHRYLMESEEESIRLDLKTDPRTIQKQARWAGIQAGMRMADLGCGPGKTSYYLNRLVQPGGSTLGIDISPLRIDHAKNHYQASGLNFVVGDIRQSLEPYGEFDFIWIRFVLEHHRSSGFEVEIAAKRSGYPFKEFEDGFEGFYSEFHSFFHDPRRFTYTPILCCRGKKA